MVLPENSYYTYHPFRDNCATSIRDIIDMGTGGQLKARFGDSEGRFSLRDHLRRFTWFRPFSDGFLFFLMGKELDKPLTVWDEMFLPAEIGRVISDFSYTDSFGAERSLVSGVELLNASKNRPPVLNNPRSQWVMIVPAGAILAVFMIFILRFRKKHPFPGRVLWGLLQSLFGLFFGGAGLILFFVAFFMNHDYFRSNYNLLFINPLILAALPLGICVIAGMRRAEKVLGILWSCIIVSDLITAVLGLFPPLYQQNQSLQLVMLFIAIILSWDFEKNRPFLQNYFQRKK
ncbi:hypothetical protein K7I13_07020 [Brucepastera parasyntrophica]|uniref:hypothetical protein n=1 Tax=Brucepastera parasyntrophica TaxID=2880008 RepID=UPI00210B18CD|nr:hypothetical protein [Brucepastera parasyntrophica]ULQ60997.1 hypothetical protein K7I13_07020 [Brucepastera parasyntrophica]